MAKYAIWNKKDTIITPSGAVYTADQWIAKYPVATIPTIDIVCAAGEINGAFFGTLGSMVEMYEKQGADFSACKTSEDKINVINDFIEAQEQAQLEASTNAVSNEELTAAALTSIAASMEYQNMLTLEDVEV